MQTMDEIKKKMDVLGISEVKLYNGLNITYDGMVKSNGEETDDVKIELPDGVKIGTEAFKYSKVEFITGKIIELEMGAFNRCHLLRRIDISEVESIRPEAFIACDSLGEIVLDKCTSIANEAFRYAKIKKLEIKSKEMYIQPMAFDNCRIDVLECNKAVYGQITFNKTCNIGKWINTESWIRILRGKG